MLNKNILKKPGLCLVTNSINQKGKDILKIISLSLGAGLDMVQLRDKNAADSELLDIGREINGFKKFRDFTFIINDRPDIALELGADGVHIGQEDMDIGAARKVLGKNKIIGVSAHSFEEAMSYNEKDIDYIGLGAIFPTAIKPDYRSIGLEPIKKASLYLKKPFIAIGGINGTNIKAVIAAGAYRIAVVRAIIDSDEPFIAVQDLISAIKTHS